MVKIGENAYCPYNFSSFLLTVSSTEVEKTTKIWVKLTTIDFPHVGTVFVLLGVKKLKKNVFLGASLL